PKRPMAASPRMRVRLSNQSRSPKPYTVRLHFAELANDSAGKRVFDVRLQDKVVLKDFDILAESGGKNKALVREFKGIMAIDTIKLQLVARDARTTGPAAPIISGMQVLAEKPGPVPPPVLGRMTRGRGLGSFVLQSEIDKLSEKRRRKTQFVDSWLPTEEAEAKRRARRGLPPEKEPNGKKERGPRKKK
ncbi:unnamed protein product, partial [marine sediment metagenome]